MISASTINPGTEPLYILDGRTISAEKFKLLNPDGFKRIRVLHGPSATALYGTRAINGAVLVTSKKQRHLRMR